MKLAPPQKASEEHSLSPGTMRSKASEEQTSLRKRPLRTARRASFNFPKAKGNLDFTHLSQNALSQNGYGDARVDKRVSST